MAAQVEGGTLLRFAPFTSTIDSGFWHKFTTLKLEELKLSEEPVPLLGHYSNGDQPGLPTRLSVEFSAFQNSVDSTPMYCFVSHGKLVNTNTMESYKKLDKDQILQDSGKQVWEGVVSGEALEDPSLLSRFFTVTYADLKKYNFFYMFGFPALNPPTPVAVSSVVALKDVWSQASLDSLCSAYDTLYRELGPRSGFFLVKHTNDSVLLGPLKDFEQFYGKDDQVVMGFCDPCTLAAHPGWPLRNFLALAGWAWSSKVTCVDVLCFRDQSRGGERKVDHSLLLKGVTLPRFPTEGVPKVVGWEVNEQNKVAPRMVNLSRTMDPAKLAESAVDLNLKLMRWRLMPELDLGTIKDSKCLLLGSGTLGCNVARGLLGWGVRNITLVDNSYVSYSNPVRQSLFVFEDSHKGGRPKCDAAADALRKIFPGVNAQGHNFTIPMPGHAIGSEAAALEETKKSVEQLEELIKSHDVVFLLLDTREARWLPTVMCMVHGKLCMNAALGFDTFMVMRHAYRPAPETMPPPLPKSCIPGNNLGCYFCSDVVAPTNSTRDRTLDQQCTVSRPGTSMLASALVVELMMSVLQHKWRGLAPASLLPPDEADMVDGALSVLGLVPHQIRGFLSHFTSVQPASLAFDQCTACSDTVLSSYREEGFGFLVKVFNSSDHLEQLTGLHHLYSAADRADIWELNDDEEF